jgi:glutathione-regulated potassium-efflux system ancillary protein KefC
VAVWVLLGVLMGLAVGAVLLSTRFGVSVGVLEILLGMALANLLQAFRPGLLPSWEAGQSWLPLLASLGSVVLTFMAGAEIDTAAFRRTWKESLALGFVSFLAPWLAGWAVAEFVLGWNGRAALLTGTALSSTSVAIVFVVLVETGRSRTETGKLLLSACFVTGFAMVLALSLLFVTPTPWELLLLAGATAAAALGGPRALRALARHFEGRPGEGEVKVLLLLLIALGGLAQYVGSQAVLPAYILGLALAPSLAQRREVLLRLRSISLAFLTPFFFLYAGLGISLTAVAAGAGAVLLLFGTKVGAKIAGIYPLAQYLLPRDTAYLALLMSTGLTFGVIAVTYGLSLGILTAAQFSVVLTAILLSAVVPTLVAETFFPPEEEIPGPVAA